jgi:hypothetical protein
MSTKPISADEFDRRFDDGEDMAKYIDWNSGRASAVATKRVNVDFPQWMVQRLDQEAKRLGITRQALIKTWVADRIDRAA